MIDEGYIKFSLKHIPGPPPVHAALPVLYRLRDALYAKQLIGAYSNGIGYGNISVRCGKTAGFLISASATGRKDGLAYDDFSEVVSFDVDRNSVFCSGPLPASSESMTHGAIYSASADVNSVIHVHNLALYNYMLQNGYPASSPGAAFGTPEMARDMGRIAAQGEMPGLIVMTGHEEGLVSYGESPEQAFAVLMDLFAAVCG